MTENEISFQIRKAAFEVHTVLGPGLLETVYERALQQELSDAGLSVFAQVGVPVSYKELKIREGFRADLIVENKVIVEVKSVDVLHDVHFKQLLTYLRLSEMKLGLLINFNTTFLKDKESMFRIVNGL